MHIKFVFPAAVLTLATLTSSAVLINAQDYTGRVLSETQERVRTRSFHEKIRLQRMIPARDNQVPREAVRLQKRIGRRFGFSPDTRDLERDIARQRDLFSRAVQIDFATDDGTTVPSLVVRPDQVPLIEVTLNGFTTEVNEAAVTNLLASLSPDVIRVPVSATLIASAQDDEVIRAQTEGIAKSGYDFDPQAVTDAVMDALENDQNTITVNLPTAPGTIINATGEDFGELQLLAIGRSNFEGSGLGRKANVRKGLNTYLNNIIVPAGEEFSINSILRNVPIREWEMALGIFNGGELRPVPGGGLCQVATTLFRGILHSGLPVTQRANHSLFVHYYEKHGVGIDATIFPASGPDLRFRNDTNHPILIQAYSEGDDATVALYGTPDGRSVNMTGPYFADNAPEGYVIDGKPLKKSQIAWERTVVYPDGRIDQYTLLSKYKAIPSSVVKEYSPTLASNTTVLHASAPNRETRKEIKDLEAAVVPHLQ